MYLSALESHKPSVAHPGELVAWRNSELATRQGQSSVSRPAALSPSRLRLAARLVPWASPTAGRRLAKSASSFRLASRRQNRLGRGGPRWAAKGRCPMKRFEVYEMSLKMV